MSAKFQVYRFLVFRKTLLKIFSGPCFQLCKEILLIVLNLIVMLKKIWAHVNETTLVQNCKFVNSKFLAHFLSPYEIVPGFVSCNLKRHRCSQNISHDQSSISSFLRSPRSNITSKRREKIKPSCAKWMGGSLRPFQIVTNNELKNLIEACLDIGTFFLEL